MTVKHSPLRGLLFFNVIYIAIGILVTLSTFIITKRFMGAGSRAGWKYVFQDELAVHKTLPKLFHSLSLHNSALFISNTDGYTYSLNRLTGNYLWRHEAQNDSIYPAAFGNNGIVYFSNFDGHLYAVNETTGKEVWRFATPGWYMADTEPVVSDSVVLFGSRNGNLYAFNMNTGQHLWTYKVTPIDISHYSQDEVLIHFGRITADNNRVYVNSATENAIISIDLKTGKELWRFPDYGFVFQDPVIVNNTVLIRNNENVYYGLNSANGNIVFKKQAPAQQYYQGSQNTYFISSDTSIDAMETHSGSLRWTYKNKQNARPVILQETQSKNLIIVSLVDRGSQISMINLITGNLIWSSTMSDTNIHTVFSDRNAVYILGAAAQCAYTNQGKRIWCSGEQQIGNISFLTDKGIYIVSKFDNLTKILLLNSQTGQRIWNFLSKDINIDNVQVYRGDIYFLSKDNKSLYMLSGDNRKSEIQDKDIQIIHNNPIILSQTSQHNPTNQPTQLNVTPQQEQARVNSVYELTISLDDSINENPYDSVKMTGLFSDNHGNTYKTTAFYYDKNTWKIRFTPAVSGKWIWQVTLYTNSTSLLRQGSLSVSESDYPGFLSLSAKNPRLFTAQKGNIFTPIGINDCVRDFNQDGNPLNQWFIGLTNKPSDATDLIDTSTMDKYLTTYRDSGFNIFRWGSGNCSFNLWKSLSPSGNRYALDSGMWLDTLFSSLRKHNYHIWMTLFSFNLPIDPKLPDTQKRDILKHYLDYAVARYAGYIDVWELANEISLNDNDVTFMSNYIRSIDPYHHPVSVNWQKPKLPAINIISIHWYSQECNLFCDGDLRHLIDPYQAGDKPIIFSEQGNWHVNWDYLSGTRMRVRLWIGFFQKAYFIFWNSSGALFINDNNGTSNIYIGPEERRYVSVFDTFISDIGTTLAEYPAHSTKPDDRVFAFSANNEIIGYIYHQISDVSWNATMLAVSVPTSSQIQWINPASGTVLSEQTLSPGDRLLPVPEFATDIAFKIEFNEPTQN